MKIIVAAVGRPALPHLRGAIADYGARIARIARPVGIEFRSVPTGSAEREGDALLASARNAELALLDPSGEMLDSEAFARRLGERIESGRGDLAFLIGGAEGHSARVRAAARWRLSLGPMTLQHELAQVVLLEQIYRAFTILKGHPYHRG